VLSRVTAEPELRVAFAAPAGATWPLPLYELALLTAATLRERGIDPDLTVVATDVFDGVLAALDHAGIDVVTGTAAAAVEGALRLDDGRVYPLYIRAEPGGATTTTTEPLWSPPVKIVGRYLTPFLAAV